MSESNERGETPRNTLIVNAQYVKDLSFENPKTPSSLINRKDPKIDVAINVNAVAIGANLFEVVLRVSVTGKLCESEQVEGCSTGVTHGQDDGTNDGGVIFVLEVEYAGLFTVESASVEEKEVILLVHCPALLFPYLRQIVSDVMHNGGYAPLLLSPFDFMELYRNKMGELHKERDVADSDADDGVSDNSDV